MNTAIKVQEIYLERIEKTNEKIFGINNTMNEINRKYQTSQEFYKNKNDEMANQLSVKIGIY